MFFKSILLPLLSLAAGVLSTDHFYTLDPTGELAPTSGYHLEGIACYVWSSKPPNVNAIPIYRWYNGNDHYYTDSSDTPAGYNSEGIGFWVSDGTTNNNGVLNDLVLFYEWYNSGNGDHFYTTDPSGELAPSSGYMAEGNIGHVFPPGPNLGHNRSPVGSQPLYRWYKP